MVLFVLLPFVMALFVLLLFVMVLFVLLLLPRQKEEEQTVP
jgi:disulfide bond formation protein DsbB